MKVYNKYIKDPVENIDPRRANQCLIAYIEDKAKNRTGIQISILYVEFDKQLDDYANKHKGPFNFKFQRQPGGATKVEYTGDSNHHAIFTEKSDIEAYAIKMSKILTLVEIKKERIKNITPAQADDISQAYQEVISEISVPGHAA